MLPPPNAHAFAVLLLTVLALVLFTREKIPLVTSGMDVLSVCRGALWMYLSG